MARESGSWTDQEIRSAETDRLNFSHFSRVLAQVIMEADTPMTIGVFGPWGSGKTSLMRLVEEALEETAPGEQQKVWTVWFNAWRYDREEALWRALILRVLWVLREKLVGPRAAEKAPSDLSERKKKLAQELDDLEASLYREVEREEIGSVTVDWEKMATGAVGMFTRLSLSMIPGLGGPLSKMADEAQKKLSADDLDSLFSAVQRQRRKLHRDHVRSLEQFRGNLETLVDKHVAKRDCLLVVFIDDLDRCLPEKAVEVLEAIKLFLDVPACVFVLGADRDVIERGIHVKYKSFLASIAGQEGGDELERRMPISGDDYLEKIVQLPFHLPPLREDVVEKFIKEYEPDLPEGCAAIFCRGLEPNPRKVKRTLSIFRLLRLLAEERVREKEMQPVEPTLLAKMVIILSRWRDLFKDLQEYPNLLQELEQMWRTGPRVPLRAEAIDGPSPREQASTETTEPALEPLQREEETLLEKYGRIKALGRMLKQGPPWFGDLTLPQLNEYLYLARSTTEAAEVAVDIDERRRADLMSNDPTRIRAAVAELDEAEKEVYAEDLLGVLRSARPPRERASAGNALALLGDPRPGVDPGVTALEHMEFCYVPPGPFWMGSSDDDPMARDDEKPLHEVDISHGYWIAQYPVTVAQWKAFLQDAGYQVRDEVSLTEVANHPAVLVSWREALEFCQWLTEACRDRVPEGYVVGLPTEVEWEKASRGGQEIPSRPLVTTFRAGLGLPGSLGLTASTMPQRRYPWGDEPDAGRANQRETGLGGTTAVGCFAAGASPYGCVDMAGNVWEWCSTLYREYRYEPDDGREDPDAAGFRVLRGGSFLGSYGVVRCAYRRGVVPAGGLVNIGFRVVVSPGSPE